MKFKEYLKNNKLDEGKAFEGNGWRCSVTAENKCWIDVNFQQIVTGDRTFSFVDVGQRLSKDIPKEIKEGFWDELEKEMKPVYDQMHKRQILLEEEVKKIVETTYTLLKAKAQQASMEYKSGEEKIIDKLVKRYNSRGKK
jgi:hypothetical protein